MDLFRDPSGTAGGDRDGTKGQPSMGAEHLRRDL